MPNKILKDNISHIFQKYEIADQEVKRLSYKINASPS